MTVEGYVQFWLALCGGGLVLGCLVAWLLIRSMTKELRLICVELSSIREGLTFYSSAVFRPRKVKL